MSGEPIDPVSFAVAVTELLERLAANASLDLKQHRLKSLDDLSPEQAVEFERDDARLALLRYDAWEWLWGLTHTDSLRVWIDEDYRWKRLSQEAVRASHMAKADDEPWRVYLDREEITSRAKARWPIPSDPPIQVEAARTPGNGRSKGKPGRPSGSGGYAKDDEPLLIEMHHLIQSGRVGTVHAAAVQVAPKAQGPTTSQEGKVRRLSDGYRRWRRRLGA
jgi:hypothetical protein